MLHVAQELITYQTQDKFPEQLSGIISRIYEKIDSGKYKNNDVIIKTSEEVKEISFLIRDRFNLNMPFDKELHAYVPAAVIPFLSDYLTEAVSLNNLGPETIGNLFGVVNIYKHVSQLEKEREAYFKRIHNRRGYVDRKLARVGGYLADVKNYLIVDFFFLKKHDITPEEASAIVLHEIGHAFTGLETHHRMSTSNSTVMDIIEDINGGRKDKAFYRFKRYFDKNDLDNSSLGNDDEITDFYGKLANKYIEELNTQMGNYKYDQTNFENLADSFATRFGMGKPLVSGLHKLHTNYGTVQSNSNLLYATLFLIDITLLALMLVLTGAIGVALCALIIFCIYNQSNSHMTYDFPIERYNRIKNSVVNHLKNQHLPKEFTRDLIKQYTFIDDVIKNSMYFKDVLSRISDWIVFNNRENNYHIQVQQNIENNLNSVLFVKSAQIRTLE